ncbi:MAG: hypothetical protein ACLVC2_15895, partial [Emergencia timonensis]
SRGGGYDSSDFYDKVRFFDTIPDFSRNSVARTTAVHPKKKLKSPKKTVIALYFTSFINCEPHFAHRNSQGK